MAKALNYGYERMHRSLSRQDKTTEESAVEQGQSGITSDEIIAGGLLAHNETAVTWRGHANTKQAKKKELCAGSVGAIERARSSKGSTEK